MKKDLLSLLRSTDHIILCRTPSRDMSQLPVDPPITVGQLLDLMSSFISRRNVELQTMDSGELAFVFRFIELQAVDESTIQLYVKAKFVPDRSKLVLISAHPDRRW